MPKKSSNEPKRKSDQKRIRELGNLIDDKNKIISKLKSLIGVTSIIESSLDEKEVLKSILDQTKILMECKHSSVLLVDEETMQLYFAVLANEEEMEKLSEIKLRKGEGIAGNVWKDCKPLLIEDAKKDNRFSQKADQKLEYTTKSIMAVPLVTNGKVIGVMEAMNKTDDSCFNNFDLEIFKSLAVQASIAINNARLYAMAITDGLTKLFIHRYFNLRLEEEFNRVKRYDRDLSLIMLDIDHFKSFNDNYGHQLGDKVLSNTAQEIKTNCRTTDVPARYGGEEFVIIVPETNKNGAIILAERIRREIELKEMKHKNKKINITISAGVSSFKDNNPNNPITLLEMADKALYYSKRNGRNQVNFFDPEKTS